MKGDVTGTRNASSFRQLLDRTETKARPAFCSGAARANCPVTNCPTPHPDVDAPMCGTCFNRHVPGEWWPERRIVSHAEPIVGALVALGCYGGVACPT